jgi:hypothetical protein
LNLNCSGERLPDKAVAKEKVTRRYIYDLTLIDFGDLSVKEGFRMSENPDTQVVENCEGNSKHRGIIFDLNEYEDVGPAPGMKTVRVFREPKSGEKIVVRFLGPVGEVVTPEMTKRIVRKTAWKVKLRHPCMIPCLGCTLPSKTQGRAEILAYIEGESLHSVLKSEPAWWQPTERAMTIVGIILFLHRIHAFGCHRGLKSECVIFDSKHHVQVGDFGLAGSRVYIAPEICSGKALGRAADIYSLGILMLQIVAGGNVISDAEASFRKFVTGVRPEIPPAVRDFMRELIDRCWAPRPEDRPSIDDVFDILVANEFRVMPGVDSERVKEYVEWVIGDCM